MSIWVTKPTYNWWAPGTILWGMRKKHRETSPWPGFSWRHPDAPWCPDALQAVLRLKLLHLLQVLIDETSDHGQSDWLSTKSYKSSFAGWLVMFHPKQKNGLNYHKLPMQLGMRCCKRLSLATWEKSIPNPPKNAWEDDPLGAGWAISKEYMGKTTMTNHSHNPRMGEPKKKSDTLLKSGT